jgi:hypothetical protein
MIAIPEIALIMLAKRIRNSAPCLASSCNNSRWNMAGIQHHVNVKFKAQAAVAVKIPIYLTSICFLEHLHVHEQPVEVAYPQVIG